MELKNISNQENTFSRIVLKEKNHEEWQKKQLEKYFIVIAKQRIEKTAQPRTRL